MPAPPRKGTGKADRLGPLTKKDRPRMERAMKELKMRMRERKILDAERRSQQSDEIKHPFGKRFMDI